MTAGRAPGLAVHACPGPRAFPPPNPRSRPRMRAMRGPFCRHSRLPLGDAAHAGTSTDGRCSGRRAESSRSCSSTTEARMIRGGDLPIAGNPTPTWSWPSSSCGTTGSTTPSWPGSGSAARLSSPWTKTCSTRPRKSGTAGGNRSPRVSTWCMVAAKKKHSGWRNRSHSGQHVLSKGISPADPPITAFRAIGRAPGEHLFLLAELHVHRRVIGMEHPPHR